MALKLAFLGALRQFMVNTASLKLSIGTGFAFQEKSNWDPSSALPPLPELHQGVLDFGNFYIGPCIRPKAYTNDVDFFQIYIFGVSIFLKSRPHQPGHVPMALNST